MTQMIEGEENKKNCCEEELMKVRNSMLICLTLQVMLEVEALEHHTKRSEDKSFKIMEVC